MNGFTLLEILIVISIILVIVVMGASSLPSFRTTTELNSSAEDGMSLLLNARSKTLSSHEESQFGVHFETDRVVLFKGTAYSSTSPDNKIVLFPARISLSTTTLAGGGNDVLFKRLTGETDNYGTIVLRLTSDASTTKTIRIEKTGVVDVQ